MSGEEPVMAYDLTGDEPALLVVVEPCPFVNWGVRCVREAGHPDDGPTAGQGGHDPGPATRTLP